MEGESVYQFHDNAMLDESARIKDLQKQIDFLENYADDYGQISCELSRLKIEVTELIFCVDWFVSAIEIEQYEIKTLYDYQLNKLADMLIEQLKKVEMCLRPEEGGEE